MFLMILEQRKFLGRMARKLSLKSSHPKSKKTYCLVIDINLPGFHCICKLERSKFPKSATEKKEGKRMMQVLPGAITWHTWDTKSLFSFVLSEVLWVSFY